MRCGCRAASTEDGAAQECGSGELKSNGWLDVEAPAFMDLMGHPFCACQQLGDSFVCELNVENDVTSVSVRLFC